MDPAMTDADIGYVRANYLSLEQACAGRRETPDDVRLLIAEGRLPHPSYVLPDETEMVPSDYFALADAGQDEFERRYLAAGGNPAEVDAEWRNYLTGDYGVCLREQTPEKMVLKDRLVTQIDRLLGDSRPNDAGWRAELRASVDELDTIERPFAPNYDRARWGPSSRDRCITVPRERFPDVFTEAA